MTIGRSRSRSASSYRLTALERYGAPAGWAGAGLLFEHTGGDRVVGGEHQALGQVLAVELGFLAL